MGEYGWKYLKFKLTARRYQFGNPVSAGLHLWYDSKQAALFVVNVSALQLTFGLDWRKSSASYL